MALRALESVLGQTTAPLEILIGDNSDSEILKQKLIEKDYYKYVKYYYHGHNIGLTENWNFLISKSKGAYIKFINDDDTLEENAIEILLRYIRFNRPALIVSRSSKLKRKIVEIIGAKSYSLCDLQNLIKVAYLDLGSPSEVMFLNTDLRFHGENYYSQDIEFFKALVMRYGSFVVIPESLCVIYKHSEQAYRKSSSNERNSQKINVLGNSLISVYYVHLMNLFITYNILIKLVLMLALLPIWMVQFMMLVYYGKKEVLRQ